ncbi:MAG: GTP-binding protein [Lachnospiraceae bacterium]|nr:GTP-binding protein [Lachnospiraceae bacterium]
MIKIDLITGFLGSGKTTFIRHYARSFLDAGKRICILENDFGAINVDRVLLQDLLGENCGMEMIVGGDGQESHQRRMRTKLIAMAMNGYERIIVEPSGIFDVDELFDLLYEEPLDTWYEMGSVLTIVDTGLPDVLSDESDYLLASQCACAGRLILSRTQLYPEIQQKRVIDHINSVMGKIGSKRRFSLDDTERLAWDDYSPEDFKRLSESGYVHDNYVKQHIIESGHFSSQFCYYLELPENELKKRIEGLFQDPLCAGVFRIKGYMHTTEGRWVQINATRESVEISDCGEAQNVLILIGEDLDKEALRKYFPLQ